MLFLDKLQKFNSFNCKITVLPETLTIISGNRAIVEYGIADDVFPFHGKGVHYYFKNPSIWFAGVVYYKIINGERHNFIEFNRDGCYPDISNTSSFIALITASPTFDVSIRELQFYDGNAMNDYFNYFDFVKVMRNREEVNNIEVGKGIFNPSTNRLHIQSDNQSDYSLINQIDEAKLFDLPISVSIGSYNIGTTLTSLPYLKLYGGSGVFTFKFKLYQNEYNISIDVKQNGDFCYLLNKSVIHDNNVVCQISFDVVTDNNSGEKYLLPKISSSIQDIVDVELLITEEFYMSARYEGAITTILQNIGTITPIILNGNNAITIDNELYRVSNVNELRFTNTNLLHSVLIPDNMDIVNYTVPGFYHKNDNIATLHSIPENLTVGFSMIIMDNGTQRPTLYMIKGMNNNLYLGSYYEGNITWYDVRTQLTTEIREWVINNFDGGGSGGNGVMFIDIDVEIVDGHPVFTYHDPNMSFSVIDDAITNGVYTVCVVHFDFGSLFFEYTMKEIGDDPNQHTYVYSDMYPTLTFNFEDAYRQNYIRKCVISRYVGLIVFENGFDFLNVEHHSFMIKCTWNELRVWRDKSDLVQGANYLITDYETKVKVLKISEAGYDPYYPWDTVYHPFMIMVTALDNNKLSEECRAVLDQNGNSVTYYQKSNLSAWKLWYCLDNDNQRFSWAPDDKYLTGSIDNKNLYYESELNKNGTTYYKWVSKNRDIVNYTLSIDPSINDTLYWFDDNDELQINGVVTAYVNGGGRGVIYRMIDEFGNDVPYDFKNIVMKMSGADPYHYTFGTDSNDYSLHKSKNLCYDNIIKSSLNESQYEYGLYSFNAECHHNIIGNGSYMIKMDSKSSFNKVGGGCFFITTGQNCRGLDIGYASVRITFTDGVSNIKVPNNTNNNELNQTIIINEVLLTRGVPKTLIQYGKYVQGSIDQVKLAYDGKKYISNVWYHKWVSADGTITNYTSSYSPSVNDPLYLLNPSNQLVQNGVVDVVKDNEWYARGYSSIDGTVEDIKVYNP